MCRLASGPKCVAKPVLGAPPFEKAADNPYIGVSPVFAQTARNINNLTFFFSQILLATIMVIYQVANFVVSHSL
jgi:hypothetical protein